jgi:SAM-dependent methyltransferase
MIYSLFQRILAREEHRKVNTFTDSQPSEGHTFNYSFAKKYIRNKSVLDIGCWTGQFEQLAVREAKKIVAIDPGMDAIKFAKHTIVGPTFLHGSATNLQFKNKSFDVVTFFDVIEHIPAHTELICLKEINRVLKPNGILLLCTPYKHMFSIIFDPSFWSQGHRHYSKDELETMLSQSGFKIETFFMVGGFWGIAVYIINMIAKHIFRIKLRFPKVIHQKLKDEFKPGGIMGIYVVAQKLVI